MSRATFAPYVIDALLTAMRARTGYRSPTSTTTGITVYDSVEIFTEETFPTSYLVIGWSGDQRDAPTESAAAPISVRAIATTSPKEEAQTTIACRAAYQIGDVAPAAARLAATAIVDEVDTVLRLDPKIGITPSSAGQVMWVQLTEVRMTQFVSSGSVCIVDFTLTISART